MQTSYRPDIDGLRALAVLSVLLFHGFPQWLPGGFVGVDVFFVISGFLITGIIVQEAQRGAFTIRSFYARRVRRIFPALLLILAFTLVVGWIMLSPSEYKALDKHLRTSVGFAANFRYLKEALAYFDPSAHSKLLLHLWSLAIEEQFYVVWPLLIALVVRFNRQRTLAALGLLTAAIIVGSLAWDIILLRTSQPAAFYQPLGRAWELLLGGGLAIWQQHAGRQQPSLRAASVLSALGLALIGWSLFAFHEGMAFPGAAALAPTLGALLVIAAGPAAFGNRWLLANRPAVAVGLISYPLYLWHWPLLAFAYVCYAGHTPAEVRVGLLLASMLLAWATYAGLEKRVRRSPQGARWVAGLVTGMILLVPLSMSIKKNDGYPDRPISKLINGDVASIVLGADRDRLLGGCGLADPAGFQWCYNGSAEPAQYLVLGDSKAEALYYGLVRESADRRWALIGSVGLPQDGVRDNAAIAYEAAQHAESVKTVLMVNAMRGVFAVDTRSGLISDPTPLIDLGRYDAAIGALERAGKRVVLVLDNPTLPDPTECIEGPLVSSPLLGGVLFRKMNPYCRLSLGDHLAGTRAYREAFAQLKQRHPDLVLVDLPALLCDAGRDVCPFVDGRNFLYSYSDHISDHAGSLAARSILPALGAELKKQ